MPCDRQQAWGPEGRGVMWGVGVPMILGWGVSKVLVFIKHPIHARYRFPHNPKVECSSEKFCKPKWCKVKKQLP